MRHCSYLIGTLLLALAACAPQKNPEASETAYLLRYRCLIYRTETNAPPNNLGFQADKTVENSILDKYFAHYVQIGIAPRWVYEKSYTVAADKRSNIICESLRDAETNSQYNVVNGEPKEAGEDGTPEHPIYELKRVGTDTLDGYPLVHYQINGIYDLNTLHFWVLDAHPLDNLAIPLFSTQNFAESLPNDSNMALIVADAMQQLKAVPYRIDIPSEAAMEKLRNASVYVSDPFIGGVDLRETYILQDLKRLPLAELQRQIPAMPR